jgi:hypothetical protein
MLKNIKKENSMTYACAIRESKKTYTNVDKNKMKKQQLEIINKKWGHDIKNNFTTVLRAKPESLPSLRLKFNTFKGYREYMQQVSPNMYIKLTGN